jgi:hypothetical protein
MDEQHTMALVCDLMADFAKRTGLIGERPPHRYLWTDAFAACNFLGLAERTGEQRFRELALGLVDQVHHVLGRHRPDDPRTGWLSGLPAEAGEAHPTQGGLRIGKRLNERSPNEPFDERLEWDRDGQYFHYLTKWMHALAGVGRVTDDARYLRWGMELAETAYARFRCGPTLGGRRHLVWKMSIDLSRPLVAAQGQHDPLDGLLTCLELRSAAHALGVADVTDLEQPIAGLTAVCKEQPLATADLLGIGGLLSGAHTLARLTVAGVTGYADLLLALLDAACTGLADQAEARDALSLPADYRLAFRELGLSIGLRALEQTRELAADNSAVFKALPGFGTRMRQLSDYAMLISRIEDFWLDPNNQRSKTWTAHRDINAVMLATSLDPEGYLTL